MQINYLGHSCFKIKTQNAVLICDPYDSYIGFKMPKVEAQIVTISHEHKDHNCLKEISGNPFVIRAPGEYEIADVSIHGLSSYHDEVKGKKRGKNTIYTIRAEDISLCHLGDLGEKLNDKQLEEINGIDVLFIPVGGTYTLGPKRAIEVINQVEPRIVIPMHFKAPSLDKKIFDQLSTLDDFLKEAGALEARKEERLTLTKTSLPEEREITVLLKK
ncbi:lactamase [Candidatus Beckwithbacteria bacterium CG10_big_fil_rev_8_21_14_0_10_34_10]|uniref:Lactamase n=1 Tax=Candidatus Beckwithbacteria bacterium CG10_big_fil_rev_8_21_14_0_10_34_10 TaxID=1974495 RepID=A0A2H0WAX7_9BACT|nr:MAG: lactamase [Candidatus Beckwithbacteria bacterium CG10_big_fil_rev_8_21_14_0_10_34_10]